MCGIAGLINKTKKKIDENMIDMMTDCIIHRGPDDSGKYIDESIGLGHRRLSIIDLQHDASQPFVSHDRQFVAVFNGEIYNYIEIRNHLESKGVSFRTQSDTEVLLESYRRWKEDCVTRFNGMWSLAIYDKKSNVLFLSRDRMGVKPLYFLNRNDFFCFASEIKSILAVFQDERIVDMKTFARFLRGIQEDSDQQTFYQNIKQLRPGHSLILDLNTETFTESIYWEVDSEKFKRKWYSKNPYHTCRMLLEDAIRIRLRADVPVGASLSGGLDSSSIVEISKKKFNKTLNTFSAIYSDKGYDEEEFIRCINDDIKANSNYIYPNKAEQLLEDINNMVWFHDGPIHCASPYSGYCVYRGVGSKVKVLLDGQGADELFAGYTFLFDSLLKEYQSHNNRLKAIKFIAENDAIWPSCTNISDKKRLEVLGVASVIRRKQQVHKTSGWISWRELLDNEVQKINVDLPDGKEAEFGDCLQRSLFWEQFHSTLPRILHDVDRNSMAFSLEVRLPFLDYRLVEFSYALPSDKKIRNGWTKYVLRKAMKRYLPKKIWSRRQKLGFPAPFEKWLVMPEYKNQIREYIESFSSRGLVNHDYVMKLYDEQIEGKRMDADMLFRFLTAEIWLRNEIDNGSKWKYSGASV